MKVLASGLVKRGSPRAVCERVLAPALVVPGIADQVVEFAEEHGLEEIAAAWTGTADDLVNLRVSPAANEGSGMVGELLWVYGGRWR